MADISLKIKSDFAQAEADFKSLIGTSEKLQKVNDVNSKEYKALSNQIDKYIEKNKLSTVAMTATQGKSAALAAEYKKLQTQIQSLISKGIDPASPALDKMRNRMLEIGPAAQKAQQSTSMFASVLKGVLGANLIQSVLYKIKDGFVGIFNEARKLEDAEAAFTPLMGGAARAKELVQALNVAAAETPFEFDAIRKATTTLLPVMNGDIQKTVDTFKMLGDTAGGNAQKLDSITRGFSKAMLKGKVDMESLNMIAEAGVPIFTEMAQSMGYGKDNMTAFFKQISTGTVSTDELVKAFQKMTGEGGIFFEGMIIASKTTSGVLSTMSDNIKMTAAGIGQKFLPLLKDIALVVIKVSSAILKWVNTGDNLNNLLKGLGYTIAIVGSAFLAYNVVTSAAAVVTGLMSGAMAALNAIMLLNPVGLIVAGLAALVVIGVIVAKNWDLIKYKFQDFASTATIGLLQLGVSIREKVMGAVSGLLEQLSKLPLIGKKFKSIQENQNKVTATMKAAIEVEKTKQSAARAAYAERKAQLKDEIKEYGKKASAMMEADRKASAASAEKAKTANDIFKAQLEMIPETEAAIYQQRLDMAQKFFTDRIAQEQIYNEEQLAMWEQQRISDIANSTMSYEQKLDAMKALQDATNQHSKKMLTNNVQFGQTMLSTTGSMLTDLQTIFKNAGKESKALALMLKAVAIGEATISSYLAFDKVLAQNLPFPVNMVAAGITLAAGLAKVGAIASTPISAQTGLTSYEVPDIRQNRNDGAPVKAQAGETVTVTPRGESTMGITNVSIKIGEAELFSIVQKGINTGEISVTNNNIGRGVFAN
jgi:tape measure domain-containing protein